MATPWPFNEAKPLIKLECFCVFRVRAHRQDLAATVPREIKASLNKRFSNTSATLVSTYEKVVHVHYALRVLELPDAGQRGVTQKIT